MMLRLAIATGLAVLATACATDKSLGGIEEPGFRGHAMILDAQGRQVARADLAQSGTEVYVAVSATDMAPGTYAAHVHMTGRCEGPGFQSAGAHWNPTGRQHGTENPQGHHLGDLPNITVGANRRGEIEYRIDNAAVSAGQNAILDADGAAVVIHARPDDHRTDPSGNSGDRIACGVLSRAG